jgi:hypothetical protein
VEELRRKEYQDLKSNFVYALYLQIMDCLFFFIGVMYLYDKVLKNTVVEISISMTYIVAL